MKIDTLRERLVNAENNIAKITGTLERHNKQYAKLVNKFNAGCPMQYDDVDIITLREYRDNGTISNDTFWTYTDIQHKEEDIKNNEKKLAIAKEKLTVLKKQLGELEAQEQLINDTTPQVIKDWAENWKQEAIIYVKDKADKYIEDKEKMKKEINVDYYMYLSSEADRFSYINKEYLDNYNDDVDYTRFVNSYNTICKIKELYGIYDIEKKYKNNHSDAFVNNYIAMKLDNDWLNTKLDEQKKTMIDNLILRVTKVTGTVTDAKALRLGNDGNINGIVEGERGKAYVETIIAGGWNIQVMHYRVLVKPL